MKPLACKSTLRTLGCGKRARNGAGGDGQTSCWRLLYLQTDDRARWYAAGRWDVADSATLLCPPLSSPLVSLSLLVSSLLLVYCSCYCGIDGMAAVAGGGWRGC